MRRKSVYTHINTNTCANVETERWESVHTVHQYIIYAHIHKDQAGFAKKTFDIMIFYTFSRSMETKPLHLAKINDLVLNHC